MSKSIIEALKELSRENHDPRFPPEAFHDIPKIRADTEQQLRFCNAEIMRIESLLERFYIEREALEKQLDLVISLQAPIRSLPVSLLQDILVQTTSTGTKAFKLGKVCSHWRSVVTHCPIFWSTLDMDKRMWRHPDADNILNHFLSRSRQHPLSAVVGRRFTSMNGNEQVLPLFWGLLTSLCGRWASLNLNLREVAPLDGLVGFQFSSLRNLRLSVSSPPPDGVDWSTGVPVPTGVPMRRWFTDAPLRSVSLTHLHPLAIELAWETLTTLEFLSVTFLSNDLQILSRCRRLQVLKLIECHTDLLDDGAWSNDWTVPITTLQVDTQSSNCALPICPNLTTFNMHNQRSGWTSPQTGSFELRRSLARYGDYIQNLSLELTNISSKLPSLVSVLDPKSSHSISDEIQPDLLCPNLKELSVALDPKNADETIATIVSVFHTRMDTGLKLLKLRLQLYTPRTWETPDPATVPLPYDITMLRSLVGRGIQVMVMHTRLRNAWDDHGEVDSCEVWHVLDEEQPDGDENKDQSEDENGRRCGIQCHFFDVPEFQGGDFGGRRWRTVDYWRFQWPAR